MHQAVSGQLQKLDNSGGGDYCAAKGAQDDLAALWVHVQWMKAKQQQQHAAALLLLLLLAIAAAVESRVSENSSGPGWVSHVRLLTV